MRIRTLIAATGLGLVATAARTPAQVAEACPGMEAGESALVGYVQDPHLGGLPMVGAVVTATWRAGGGPATAEAVVPADGVYLLCGLPQGIEITLRATMSELEGPEVTITLTEEGVRQDLSLSLAAGRGEDAPLFIGPDSSGRCPDLQSPHLVECIVIDDCRYTRLGNVSARRVGSGSDTREIVERFVRQARRLEVHAVRDVRAEWTLSGNVAVLVSLEGTGIEFTEERCKRWVTDPIS